MTLGEKIKEARKQCGLSQEQLAEKMAVSRSAVVKWEANNGLPDVDNLKSLAAMLNVSIDYLLDNGKPIDTGVIREPYNLSDYGKGIRKRKKDRVIYEKYPKAEIHTLLGKLKLTKSEKVIDHALAFFTAAPYGMPDLINGLKNLDKEFYLVTEGDKQYFVTVTDEFIESRRLVKHIVADKFEIGNWEFIKCKYEVKY